MTSTRGTYNQLEVIMCVSTCTGVRLLNVLPQVVKVIPGIKQFNHALKANLFEHCIYFVNEFIDLIPHFNKYCKL